MQFFTSSFFETSTIHNFFSFVSEMSNVIFLRLEWFKKSIINN